MARKKEGTEIKKRAPARRTISPAVSFFSAAQIPAGMPITSTQPMAHTARWKVMGNRRSISSSTGFCVR